MDDLQVKECPKCGVMTEKSGGCNKMTCSNCQSIWCFFCGKPYPVKTYKRIPSKYCKDAEAHKKLDVATEGN